LRGEYPAAHPKGLPIEAMGIQDGDFEKMRAPVDFVGVNLYTRTIVKAAPSDGGPLSLGALPVGPMGGNDGPKTDFGWEVWPNALRDILLRITKDYDRPVLEVTENGCSYGDAPDAHGVVHDTRRIEFYRGYLEGVHSAIQSGADVRGYHAWTLLDNFEWSEGFAQRFGLAWVDFDTCERTLKESGRWYGQVARENALEV
jgi:beta-glucosidase